MMELFQAEWCPTSRRVRELLTELDVSYVIRQVPVDRADRDALFAVAGSRIIPALVLEDGTALIDEDEIRDWLEDHVPTPAGASRHRAKAESMRLRRDATGAHRARPTAHLRHNPRGGHPMTTTQKISHPAAQRLRAWPGWPLERILFALAGTVTLVSVVLAATLGPWWLVLAAFVGINQLAFVVVGDCVASVLLRGSSVSSGGVSDERLDVAARAGRPARSLRGDARPRHRARVGRRRRRPRLPCPAGRDRPVGRRLGGERVAVRLGAHVDPAALRRQLVDRVDGRPVLSVAARAAIRHSSRSPTGSSRS